MYDIILNVDMNKKIYLNNLTSPLDAKIENLYGDYFSQKPISFFEIFNFKSIAKNENGLLQNQLILIVKQNILYAFDIYLNFLGSVEFKEKIISIKTFKNQEGII